MKTFEHEHNRKLIRKYIKSIKNDEKYSNGYGKDDDGYEYNSYDLMISYLIIIHNFLLIEEKFYSDVKLCGKEINKYLKLKDTTDFDYIMKLSEKLYNPHHMVRCNIETLDSIESVRVYLMEMVGKNINVYNKIHINLD